MAIELYGSRVGTTLFHKTIKFCDWLHSRRSAATAQDVQDHFNVSRATAYRWLGAYGDARALWREPRSRGKVHGPLDVRSISCPPAEPCGYRKYGHEAPQ